MSKIRLGLQTVFIILMAYIGYQHQAFGGGPNGVPPLDAYCPFGALETLPFYLLSGNYLQKTASSNFWLLTSLIITTFLAGAVFCGWICPLGGLADWLYKLRQKVFTRKIEPSPSVAKVLSYSRFVMLAGIVYFSWMLNKLWFEEYDPFKQIFHMNVEGTTGWLVIAAFVVMSLTIERSWCRFLCPLGAFTGLLSRLALFDIERDSSCISCNKCNRTCPGGIEVSAINRMQDTRCIKCLQCVQVCPVKSLAFKAGISGIAARVKPLALALLGVAVFTTILGFAQLSGTWNAKSPNMPVSAQITNPVEIKGWMKWSDVISALKLNEQQLLKELGLPETIDKNKTVKEIRKEYNVSEEQLRQSIEKLQKK